MAGDVTIILGIIVTVFIGIWAAIKAIDEETDNKLVFFVPAVLLTLPLLLFILYGGSEDVFAFIACLFVLGPIVVMLVVVGFQQGKVPQMRSNFTKSNRNTKPRKKKDLYRKLAPSYIRAYDRLIEYVQVRGGGIKSREEGIRRLDELSFKFDDAERFFSSPYVIKTLNLQPIDTPKEQIAETSEPEDKWWEEDADEPETQILDSGFKEISPAAVTAPASSSSEMCGHSGCSNQVTAFDFRCFTCRKRFCKTHGGSGVDCADCS